MKVSELIALLKEHEGDAEIKVVWDDPETEYPRIRIFEWATLPPRAQPEIMIKQE